VDRSHAVIGFPIRACTFYRFIEKFGFLDRGNRENLCCINETNCPIIHTHTHTHARAYMSNSNSVLANHMRVIVSNIDS